MTSFDSAKRLRCIFVTLATALAAAMPAGADEHHVLTEGVHRGTMRLSGIPTQSISLIVSAPDEDGPQTTAPTLRIVTEDSTFALIDVDLDDDRLEFTFEPGFEVRCALKRVEEEGVLEGAFEGQCDAEDDSGGRLRLSISAVAEPVAPAEPAEPAEPADRPDDPAPPQDAEHADPAD